MNRIDALDNVAGQFSDGDPQSGTPATVVGAKWLNAVQAEIINVIEAAGLVASDADLSQLTKAIQYYGGSGSFASNGWVRFGSGLIVQWGINRTTYTAEQTVSTAFPTTFPNACLALALTVFGDAQSDFTINQTSRSAGGFVATVNAASDSENPRLDGFDFIALGF